MKHFFKSKITMAVVVLTISVLLFFALTTGDGAKANLGKDGINMVMQPFQIAFTRTAKSVNNFFLHFKDLDEEKRKNKELELEVAALKDRLRQNEDYKAENDRFRDLINLNIKPYANEAYIAEIIARSVSNWNSEFTISKGSVDGIKKDDVVISSKGLVGYVCEVGTTWARVRTILNNGTSVGVKIVRSQEFAITTGELDLQNRNQMKLGYISENTNLLIGDSIETSGLGGIYPAGLLVGTVIDMQKNADNNIAIVETAIDFANLSEVMVIR